MICCADSTDHASVSCVLKYSILSLLNAIYAMNEGFTRADKTYEILLNFDTNLYIYML